MEMPFMLQLSLNGRRQPSTNVFGCLIASISKTADRNNSLIHIFFDDLDKALAPRETLVKSRVSLICVICGQKLSIIKG